MIGTEQYFNENQEPVVISPEDTESSAQTYANYMAQVEREKEEAEEDRHVELIDALEESNDLDRELLGETRKNNRKLKDSFDELNGSFEDLKDSMDEMNERNEEYSLGNLLKDVTALSFYVGKYAFKKANPKIKNLISKSEKQAVSDADISSSGSQKSSVLDAEAKKDAYLKDRDNESTLESTIEESQKASTDTIVETLEDGFKGLRKDIRNSGGAGSVDSGGLLGGITDLFKSNKDGATGGSKGFIGKLLDKSKAFMKGKGKASLIIGGTLAALGSAYYFLTKKDPEEESLEQQQKELLEVTEQGGLNPEIETPEVQKFNEQQKELASSLVDDSKLSAGEITSQVASNIVPSALMGATTMAIGKKIAEKKVAEKAEKVVLKEAGEVAVAKIGGKLLAKTIGKRIPGLGLLVGAGFGLQRALKGDFTGAALEVASGAASLLDLVAPGMGLAAGLAIEAGLTVRDIKKETENQEIVQEEDPLATQKEDLEKIKENVEKDITKEIQVRKDEITSKIEQAQTEINNLNAEDLNKINPNISVPKELPKIEGLSEVYKTKNTSSYVPYEPKKETFNLGNKPKQVEQNRPGTTQKPKDKTPEFGKRQSYDFSAPKPTTTPGPVSVSTDLTGPQVPDVSGEAIVDESLGIKDLKEVATGKTGETAGVNEGFLYNFLQMAKAYKDKFGQKIKINSGFRSIEEQARLYKEKGPGYAAKPGRSLHNFGFALDINSQQANQANKAGLFAQYHINRPMAHEPWHIEPAGIDRQAVKKGDVEITKVGTEVGESPDGSGVTPSNLVPNENSSSFGEIKGSIPEQTQVEASGSGSNSESSNVASSGDSSNISADSSSRNVDNNSVSGEASQVSPEETAGDSQGSTQVASNVSSDSAPVQENKNAPTGFVNQVEEDIKNESKASQNQANAPVNNNNSSNTTIVNNGSGGGKGSGPSVASQGADTSSSINDAGVELLRTLLTRG